MFYTTARTVENVVMDTAGCGEAMQLAIALTTHDHNNHGSRCEPQYVAAVGGG